mmetsp:Transcript_5776/g.14952  ORF Transcript_5776/g.14952 Transcript_5776/m.14952 type:complete len:169 (+) Transcript_5776:643-1149(+)|eukprot:CAMPEP_0197422828 /NCGR_PEP_ID=MMETSP1170-20131217/17643_1 /TAXON_ID=54406 /ORGANISM="Sarcinochrysis sp, Strain CCMP770" /LENGTH=168 /DNA_ID=CAMNT_0042950197 /DNA_START=654 /DNA_END=1160 /DNA_ORIENTATION=+
MTANPTIGASFLQKHLEVVEDDGTIGEVTLQLWDTAGQERFRSMAPMYYRGASAAIIVFDVTKADAWDNLEAWRTDLLAYAGSGVVLSVVGNKCDMPRAESLNLECCRATCEAWKASLHFTSALTGEGVDELFRTLACRALRQTSRKEHSILQLPVVPKGAPSYRFCC